MPTAVLLVVRGLQNTKIPFLRDRRIFAWTYDLYTSQLYTTKEIEKIMLCNLADIPGENSKIVPDLSA